MRRRDFIKVIGGGAAAWPLAVRAQQPEHKRIAVLMNTASGDKEGQAGITAFRQGLQLLGWTVDDNVRMEIRWAENNVDLDRRYATELVALAPDVILASGTPSVAALQHLNRMLPIVFVRVSDPVGGGFVDDLARPGRNATGFMLFEYTFAGKWLELLKQIVPQMARAAVLRDASNRAGIGEFAAIQAVASSLGVEIRPVDTRDASEIERALAAFAASPNGGLIVTPSASVSSYREAIISLASRYKLPAVYGVRTNVVDGGLISYGPDRIEQFRRAAGYVDRILKGEKPANLPVQAPTKFTLAVNLKTAKAIGLTIPPAILARVDEVIE